MTGAELSGGPLAQDAHKAQTLIPSIVTNKRLSCQIEPGRATSKATHTSYSDKFWAQMEDLASTYMVKND